MGVKSYALLGEKLGHSLSPQVHEAVFRRMGLRAAYQLVEVPRAEFAARAVELLNTLDGANVTIPYKVEVLPLLSGLSDRARTVGAVNTVAPTPDGLRGYNTDVTGFETMLRTAGIDPAGKPCFILGTGGASLAASAALREMGAGEIRRVSRSPEGQDIGYEALTELFSGILVNTTPAGMKGFPADCPLTPSQLRRLLPRAEAVVDAVYCPGDTPLVAAARRQGLNCCGGLTMLVAQAVAAEELWQGRALPAEWVEEITEEAEAWLK